MVSCQLKLSSSTAIHATSAAIVGSAGSRGSRRRFTAPSATPALGTSRRWSLPILTHKAVHEGAVIPWGWGVAYQDYPRRVWVVYPIPLNFVVGWLRSACYALMRGPRDRLFAEWNQALSIEGRGRYELGFKDGKAAARAALNKAFDDFVEESRQRRAQSSN